MAETGMAPRTLHRRDPEFAEGQRRLRGGEVLSFAFILLLATLLRVGRPTLTEFKFSEARLAALALDWSHTGRLPLVGVPSSAGFDHSPVSVYLYLPAFLLTADPIPATVYGGLVGVAAVALTWWLARRWPLGGRRAAPIAALLLAVNPWAVAFSRKIWQVAFVPLLVLIFLALVVSALVERRRWSLAGTVVALALLIQVHPSAISLAAALALWLLLFWREVRPGPLLVGGLLGLLTAVPFLLHQVQNDWPALAALRALPEATWDLEALRLGWEAITGRGIAALAGEAAPLLPIVPDLGRVFDAVGLGVAAAALGLAWRMVRNAFAQADNGGERKKRLKSPLKSLRLTARLRGRVPRTERDASAQADARPTARQARFQSPVLDDGGERKELQARRRAARLDFILLTALILPLLLNLRHNLTLHLHFFALVIPPACLIVGRGMEALFARRPSRAVRAVVLTALGLLTAAQVAALVLTARFVAEHETPGGFGTPLRTYRAVADALVAAAEESGAAEVLVVGQGDSVVVDGTPAIFDILLRGRVAYRFVDGRAAALFPPHKTLVLLTPDAGEAARWYAPWPMRPIVGGYRLVFLDGGWPQEGLTGIAGPRLFQNGVEVQGYRWEERDGSGTFWLLWQVLWRDGEDSHFSVRIVDGEGDLLGQQDTVGYPTARRRKGDRIINKFDIILQKRETGAHRGRVEVYRYPSLVPVPLIGSDGRPVGDAVIVGPLR